MLARLHRAKDESAVTHQPETLQRRRSGARPVQPLRGSLAVKRAGAGSPPLHLRRGLARRARRVRRARVTDKPIARDAKHKERGQTFLAGCNWRMFDAKCLPIESAEISAACFSAETPE